MHVLITGADGFVGRHLVRRLVADGHAVVAAVRPGYAVPAGVRPVELQLQDQESVAALATLEVDAVVHLAAVASGADAASAPGEAWVVNAAGTARLCDAFGRRSGGADRVVLVASTGEVYGAGSDAPRTEEDPPAPCSPYAASKVGAETAAMEVHRRTGLRVLVARAFPHTGAGQDCRFVIPAWARRLWQAKRTGGREIPVGNLTPVRDYLHVADVVDAYVRLLRGGRPGETYNVASGVGVTLRSVFTRLATLVEVDAVPVADPRFARPVDLSHLVGDATKLRTDTGWAPQMTLEHALGEVVRAQAD